MLVGEQLLHDGFIDDLVALLGKQRQVLVVLGKFWQNKWGCRPRRELALFSEYLSPSSCQQLSQLGLAGYSVPALLYQLLQRSHFRLQLAKAAPISLAPSSPGEPTLLIVLERCDEVAHEAQDVFSHVSGFLGR